MTRTTTKLIFSLFIIAAMALYLASAAYAADFEVSYSAKVDTILSTESGKYQVNITNNVDDEVRFQIYTISSYWDLSPTIVTVPANGTKSFVLEISPLSSLMGPQLVPVTIKSLESEETMIENFYMYVRSTDKPASYVPNVAMEVKIDSEIDPREIIPLEVYLRNRNPLNITELRVSISSEIFQKEYTTVLGPLEEKTNQVIFGLEPMQKPGTYTINVKLYLNNTMISEVQKDISIKAYSQVNTDQTTSKTYLASRQTITLVNNGNYAVTKDVKVPMSWPQRVFTTSDPDYNVIKENGISYLSWNVELGPREESSISIKTDYTILLVIFIIIVAVIVLYYTLRSPLLIYKRAKILSSSDDGVSEIKVKIHVKNRTGKVVKNIKIVDKYPKIVVFEDDSSIGMMKPVKLMGADKSHSSLMWNLDVLEPYEERLFTYKLRSTLKIVGNMSLPSSKVKFQSKTGERTAVSNNVLLPHKSEHSLKHAPETAKTAKPQ